MARERRCDHCGSLRRLLEQQLGALSAELDEEWSSSREFSPDRREDPKSRRRDQLVGEVASLLDELRAHVCPGPLVALDGSDAIADRPPGTTRDG